MLDKLLEWARFIVELSTKKLVLLLLLLVLGGAGYRIYELTDDNKKLDATIHTNLDRYNANIDNLQKKIADCNDSRIRDAEESSKYWREKVDELQAEVRRNYEKIKRR